MKLAILGGGGFRTPFVYQALLRQSGTPMITEVVLHDVDEARLHTMSGVLRQLAASFGGGTPHESAPRVLTTTLLEPAVTGADFIFAAARIGGLRGRVIDEQVALELGLLGQETTGPGGLAYALRTIQPMLRAAELIRKVAPGSYVLNFTNPAGIITEAMQSVLGDRVFGICDTPSGLGRRVAAALGADSTRVQMDYIGLNHLGWMRRVLVDGSDLLPELLADDELLPAMEESDLFGTEWIRLLRSMPNEYLYYYYNNRDAAEAIRSSPRTRGEYLAQTQQAFYDGALRQPEEALAMWRATLAARSANYMAEAHGTAQGAATHARHHEDDPAQQGYAGVALAAMNAIARNESATMILNVRNRGTIAALPDDAVVEVPTLVDANGVHPLATAAPNAHQLGMMASVKAAEQLTITAATHADPQAALQAFAVHPLVGSVRLARSLLEGYVSRNPLVAEALGRRA